MTAVFTSGTKCLIFALIQREISVGMAVAPSYFSRSVPD